MSTAVSTKRETAGKSPAAIRGGAMHAVRSGRGNRCGIFCIRHGARRRLGVLLRYREGHLRCAGPGDGRTGEDTAFCPGGVEDRDLISNIQDHRQGILRGVDDVKGLLALQPEEVIGVAVQHGGADLRNGAGDLRLIGGVTSASPSVMRPLSARARR